MKSGFRKSKSWLCRITLNSIRFCLVRLEHLRTYEEVKNTSFAQIKIQFAPFFGPMKLLAIRPESPSVPRDPRRPLSLACYRFLSSYLPNTHGVSQGIPYHWLYPCRWDCASAMMDSRWRLGRRVELRRWWWNGCHYRDHVTRSCVRLSPSVASVSGSKSEPIIFQTGTAVSKITMDSSLKFVCSESLLKGFSLGFSLRMGESDLMREIKKCPWKSLPVLASCSFRCCFSRRMN